MPLIMLLLCLMRIKEKPPIVSLAAIAALVIIAAESRAS
jgi:hypothetical protein